MPKHVFSGLTNKDRNSVFSILGFSHYRWVVTEWAGDLYLRGRRLRLGQLRSLLNPPLPQDYDALVTLKCNDKRVPDNTAPGSLSFWGLVFPEPLSSIPKIQSLGFHQEFDPRTGIRAFESCLSSAEAFSRRLLASEGLTKVDFESANSVLSLLCVSDTKSFHSIQRLQRRDAKEESQIVERYGELKASFLVRLPNPRPSEGLVDRLEAVANAFDSVEEKSTIEPPLTETPTELVFPQPS